jgi:hypothetical protein
MLTDIRTHGILLIIIALSLFAWHVPTSHAQQFLSASNEIVLNVNPEYPEPNQQISFSVRSFAVDLDSRPIQWFINGSPVGSGIGYTTITATTGDIGTPLIVEAQVRLATELVTKRREIIPGGVDLLWEAPKSYTPAFYRGRTLPVREAPIRVVAFPRIEKFPSSSALRTYIYEWRKGFRVEDVRSGYGKDAFSFLNRFTSKSEEIGVLVNDRQRNFEAEDASTIKLFSPEIYFHEKDELFGKNVLASQGQFETFDRTLTLIAEPFFFYDTDKYLRNLEFKWQVGDQNLSSSNGQPLRREATIQATDAGQNFLAVTINNPVTFFQEAANDLLLIFR